MNKRLTDILRAESYGMDLAQNRDTGAIIVFSMQECGDLVYEGEITPAAWYQADDYARGQLIGHIKFRR